MVRKHKGGCLRCLLVLSTNLGTEGTPVHTYTGLLIHTSGAVLSQPTWLCTPLAGPQTPLTDQIRVVGECLLTVLTPTGAALHWAAL